MEFVPIGGEWCLLFFPGFFWFQMELSGLRVETQAAKDAFRIS
jgi:hypothetical protein